MSRVNAVSNRLEARCLQRVMKLIELVFIDDLGKRERNQATVKIAETLFVFWR